MQEVVPTLPSVQLQYVEVWTREQVVRPPAADLMLVSFSVTVLCRHPEGTPRSLICKHGAESAARQGRGKELAVTAGLGTPKVLSTSPAITTLSKGYRGAAGRQPAGKGLTLGAGGLLLVGGSCRYFLGKNRVTGSPC